MARGREQRVPEVADRIPPGWIVVAEVLRITGEAEAASLAVWMDNGWLPPPKAFRIGWRVGGRSLREYRWDQAAVLAAVARRRGPPA